MVSVLMCTYNRRFCLKQAIDSVLCQTYPDFEFVIVDDGSTDGTEELIKSYQDPRIRYFKLNRNSFYCYAQIRGLITAKETMWLMTADVHVAGQAGKASDGYGRGSDARGMFYESISG